MTDSPSNPKPLQSVDRQRQLLRQRRQKFWRGTWRTFVLLGFSGFLGWAVSQPEWKIRQSNQVTVVGNQQIDTQTLEHLMALKFPTSLMRLNPQNIAKILKSHAHVEQVIVGRKLFPPQVKVWVVEAAPIAQASCDRCTLIIDPQGPNPLQLGPANLWLIDRRGIALPINSYPKLQQSQQLPALQLESYLDPLPPQQAATMKLKPNTSQQWVTVSSKKQAEWKQMYRQIEQSPVQITAINWSEAHRLTLQTSLGRIQLGLYSRKFKRQLQAIDELRTLSKSVEPKEIVYIDLENPENPILETRNSPRPKPSPDLR
ncbi:MAG: FtsQ-type POTRA domain-containing protein [Acaryochloridaceae cyanobacterium SU_2_1]|nr:FtsQ-type POTRA domain-containing protein [Acaryochloridaceae cyanobacterium SU_2_1]